MSFDAEAFFGGRKSKRGSSNGIPDLDDFINTHSRGYDMGQGFLERIPLSQGTRRHFRDDDINNNGFVDDLDFAHPPKASGKRTRQARLLGTDENNVAFGLQKFGNAVGRSESDIDRIVQTRRSNKKKRLKAAVELAERNPKRYNLQQAYEQLENFEEKELRRKAGKKSTRPYLTGDRELAGERISKLGSSIKNEIGYRISKSKMKKKIKQLEESRKTEKRLKDPEEKKEYRERLEKMYDTVDRHKDESVEERMRHNRLKENLSDRDRNELK